MKCNPGAAVVTGATGQDGYLLIGRLLDEGWTVHATVRSPEASASLAALPFADERLRVHIVDLLDRSTLHKLVQNIEPHEFYNLAGQSSVSQSFSEPWYTWQTNAEAVVGLLEGIRLYSPYTRFYQASSTDIFGFVPGGTVLHNEDSALNPQSPYASAKAAAYMLCRSYREAYGLRIACGVLSNHESHRRAPQFLTRKVVDYVRALKKLSAAERRCAAPLAMGNLKIERDWGYAPDYVQGMVKIARQIPERASQGLSSPKQDVGANYRDYVLATGRTHAVWQLVDRAFAIAGFTLEWQLDGDDPTMWRAYDSATGGLAVVVDPSLLRPADPLSIQLDATRARKDLGWAPQVGLDVFLQDMLANDGCDATRLVYEVQG
jgi:GDPmannose 4,6-dehydratase